MEGYVSAGSYNIEKDFSAYARNVANTLLGLVGTATKGQPNVATIITSPEQGVETFGPNSDLSRAITEYLAVASRVTAVRVTDGTETKAGFNVPASNTQGAIVSNLSDPFIIYASSAATVTGTETENFTINAGINDKLAIRVDGGGIQSITLVPGNRTAVQIINDINGQSSGLLAEATTSGRVKLTSNTIGSSSTIEFLPVADSAYAVLGFAADGELVSNGGFESGDPPTGWVVSGTAILSASSDAYAGAASLSVIAAANQDGAYQDISVTPGFSYETTIRMKAAAGNEGRLRIVNQSGAADINVKPFITTNDGWELITAAFTAPAGCTVIRLYLEVQDVNDEVLFDNISTMKQLGIATGNEGTDRLDISINAGSTQSFLLPSGSITAADVVNTLASLVGGTAEIYEQNYVRIRTNTYGASGSIQVLASSTADTVLGFDNLLHAGLDSGGVAFNIEAIDPGTEGNKLSVKVANGTRTGFIVVIYYKNTTATNAVQVEVFDNLSKDPSDARYIETIINGSSKLIQITDNPLVPSAPDNGMYQLSGGTDGTTGITDSHYIGDLYPERTGLQIMADKDLVNITLLATPGVSSPAVVNEMISICETRADCTAIIDCPFGLTPQQAVEWANGTGSYAHAAFNSSYAAFYYPWVEILDKDSDLPLWVPPTTFIPGIIAASLNGGIKAPAGEQRGRLTKVIRAERELGQGDRDLLNGESNIINPIATFANIGIVVYGQKTAQRNATALDRLKVRLLLNTIKKIVSGAVRYLVFEPHDEFTWREYTGVVNPILRSYTGEGRALYKAEVICNKGTNPDDQIDRNVMRARLLLQPVKDVEILINEYALTRTGAQFSDYYYVQ